MLGATAVALGLRAGLELRATSDSAGAVGVCVIASKSDNRGTLLTYWEMSSTDTTPIELTRRTHGNTKTR